MRRTLVSKTPSTAMFAQSQKGVGGNGSNYVKGSMVGGVPRIYYGWMQPGSMTRKRFEKMKNPFVDLEAGTSIYHRDFRDPVEAIRAETDSIGAKGTDNAVDLYNEYRVIPDLYPEGFQWKHKLNTEYNQWRSNTWMTPELIPPEHRGRLLCNFQVNVLRYDMRVAKFSPTDHRQWIFCSVYVGSGKGIAGYGQAVAPSTAEAKREAIKSAFGNLIGVNLEDEGPIYPLRINHEGARVTLFPSTKMVGQAPMVDLLCAFGFSYAGVQVSARATNKPRNYGTRIEAVFKLVSQMRSSTEIAHARGKIPASLVSNMFPYLEEIRRRKGMFAQHPLGKDGLHLSPNRVVDNRMPDHLKKGYYDDKYWRDFFAGAPGRLNEPRIGMRSDELRDLVPPTTERAPALVIAAKGKSKRRTLSEVLNRMGRSADSLGSMQVANPYNDMKLTSHVKSLFHLH